MRRLTRVLPLLALLALAAVAWAVAARGSADWGELSWRGLSWQGIAGQIGALRAAATAHPVMAPVAFAAVYLAVTALCVPGGALLSVTGGALFGTTLGTAAVVCGATTGALVLFLAARTAFAAPLRRRAAPLLAKIGPGIERDGFFYLLAIRLVPLVPFWLANLAPALVGMRLAPFAAATLLGIIPATAVFAAVGAGLGDTIGDAAGAGHAPNLSTVLAPRIVLPLCLLAALALVPVAWRTWKRLHA